MKFPAEEGWLCLPLMHFFVCVPYLPQCIGFKSGPELAEAFASADIFLFPSEVYSSSSSSMHHVVVDHLTLPNTHVQVETFGRVTLEACASGMPCIVDKGARPSSSCSSI